MSNTGQDPEIFRSIPLERLASYRLSDTSGPQEQLERYFHNVRLTEALYPSLSCLEVTLRNHIHDAISAVWGDNWLEMFALIHPKEAEKVQAAQAEVIRGQKKPTTGRVIAELSFGFWTSLLHARYEQSLWPRITKQVFPHAPKSAQYRKTLFERLDRIRRLRNRAFHHEPILYGLRLHQKHYPLKVLHTETRETIKWMSIEVDQWLEEIDRFADVCKV
jgi:hypothetical protein